MSTEMKAAWRRTIPRWIVVMTIALVTGNGCFCFGGDGGLFGACLGFNDNDDGPRDPAPRPCDRDRDCATGRVCISEFPGTEGICSDPSTQGGVCSEDPDCVEGLACIEDACVALLGEGDDCGGGFEICDNGLECVGSPPNRTCEILEGAGDPCRDTEECLPGLVCADAQCLPPPTPGTCLTAADCGDGEACVYQDDTTVCLALGAQGDRCEPGVTPCDEGLRCRATDDAEPNTCEPLAAAGEFCGSDADCVVGAFCVELGTTTVCSVPGRIGDECTSEVGCDPAYRCRPSGDSLTCQTLGGFGGACNDNPDCAQPFRCLQSGDDRLCLPERFGATCADEGDCGGFLFCAQSGNCALFGTEGTPCESSDVCGDGLVCRLTEDDVPCLDEDCRVETRCAPIGLEGDPCSRDAQCEGNLVCRYAEEPRCAEAARFGGACEPGDRCDERAVCRWNGSSYRCLFRASAGEACEFDDDCADPGFCAGDESVARLCTVDPLPAGSACQRDVECEPPLSCAGVPGSRFCGDVVDEDDPCLLDSDCAGALICRPTDCGVDCVTDPVCAAEGDTGEPCDEGSDCESGSCVDGLCGAEG